MGRTIISLAINHSKLSVCRESDVNFPCNDHVIQATILAQSGLDVLIFRRHYFLPCLLAFFPLFHITGLVPRLAGLIAGG